MKSIKNMKAILIFIIDCLQSIDINYSLTIIKDLSTTDFVTNRLILILDFFKDIPLGCDRPPLSKAGIFGLRRWLARYLPLDRDRQASFREASRWGLVWLPVEL
ncbi:hypothetical protein ACHMW5_12080 [Azospirillum melinis]|uniref:hypothetical protein n=1 Tax=Azospirillum melinis TaxID=328839 RepID=UPI003756464A